MDLSGSLQTGFVNKTLFIWRGIRSLKGSEGCKAFKICISKLKVTFTMPLPVEIVESTELL